LRTTKWTSGKDCTVSAPAVIYDHVVSLLYLTHAHVGTGLGRRRFRSSFYIDYVKLRGLLNRAKASAELRDELIKRMPPDVVAEVARIRKDRLAGSSSAVGEKNSDDLSGSLKTGNHLMGVIDEDESDSVSTPLLKKNSSTHIHQTLRQVTSYLGLADDRDVLLEAYVVVDNQLRSFEQAYEKEVCSQIFIGVLKLTSTV
jgi:hypothetical protein